MPNEQPLPDLFDFSEEEKGSTTADVMKQLIPSWYDDKQNGIRNLGEKWYKSDILIPSDWLTQCKSINT